MSSFVFVPKESIKQQLQAIRTGTISWPTTTENVGITDVLKHIFKTKGIKGFYPSYRATLMRNIPSAIVRFTVYEELKIMIEKF